MKNLALIAITLFIVNLCKAQNLPVDTVTKSVTYSEIVKVDSTVKSELYSRCRSWFAKSFVSANQVLQMDDKESGQLIGKGSHRGDKSYGFIHIPFDLTYTISVYLKDNKYKYEITDFTVKDEGRNSTTYTLYQIASGSVGWGLPTRNGKGAYKALYIDYAKTTEAVATTLISSLKEFMNNKTPKNDF